MVITISIDDIHPEPGWGIEGDECMYYLEELNKEFGAKYTLFIPSNYHNRAKLSENKDWIDWLKSKKYFELAAHGHYHQCKTQGIGECEFYELQTLEQVEERLNLLFKEWKAVNHSPLGWRNPGWLASPSSIKGCSSKFKYAALHYEHNLGYKWDCKMFFGHDGINETDISLHNNYNTVMFQSHIAGDWNDNVWNEKNYKQVKSSLSYLLERKPQFKTLSECL